MNFIQKGFLILLLPLLAFTEAHKYYVSVTNIEYNEKQEALQITSRIFIDDLESLLNQRYDINANLGTEVEYTFTDEYLEKYFKTKFTIEINGEIKPYVFIGKKYDTDMTIIYLEVPKVNFSTLKTIQVQNKLLTDLFDEQKNIVHFKIKQKKKSFVLIKTDAKGMLNF